MMGIGLSELVIILSVLVVGLGGTVFWAWMLVDCATKEADPNTKVVWIIIIAITHLIGAGLYFFIRRPERRRELGR